MDVFGGGMTGRFRVDCEYKKTDGGTALLVGSESQFGSTDPVDDDMKVQQHSHI
jgi:hypothetical protein